MTFEQAIVTCLRKYATFEGRASRSEFWWFQAFILLMLFAVGLISSLDETAGGFALIAWGAGVFVPNLSVTARRLHDVGWSGWWYLIILVPLGSMALLVLCVLASESGPNRYGPEPGRMDDPPDRGPHLRELAADTEVRPSRIPRVPRPK